MVTDRKIESVIAQVIVETRVADDDDKMTFKRERREKEKREIVGNEPSYWRTRRRVFPSKNLSFCHSSNNSQWIKELQMTNSPIPIRPPSGIRHVPGAKGQGRGRPWPAPRGPATKRRPTDPRSHAGTVHSEGSNPGSSPSLPQAHASNPSEPARNPCRPNNLAQGDSYDTLQSLQ